MLKITARSEYEEYGENEIFRTNVRESKKLDGTVILDDSTAIQISIFDLLN